MPSATEVINNVLGAGGVYRLLSAVAHGHQWASRQLCYEPHELGDEVIGGVPTKAFVKRATLDKVGLLAGYAARVFIRPLWNQCRYFGWNALQFEEVFENAADQLRISIPWRFWRNSGQTGEEKDLLLPNEQ